MIEDCVMTTLSPPGQQSLPATIVLIAGDGVGQEVIPAATPVVNRELETVKATAENLKKKFVTWTKKFKKKN